MFRRSGNIKPQDFPTTQQLCSEKKNISSFISLCLRPVHSLCSFRSRLYIHFEILIHYDYLHFIPLSFISPTSAPHSISGLVTPYHKTTLSFHCVQRLLVHPHRKPCKLCKICNLPPTKATS